MSWDAVFTWWTADEFNFLLPIVPLVALGLWYIFRQDGPTGPAAWYLDEWNRRQRDRRRVP